MLVKNIENDLTTEFCSTCSSSNKSDLLLSLVKNKLDFTENSCKLITSTKNKQKSKSLSLKTESCISLSCFCKKYPVKKLINPSELDEIYFSKNLKPNICSTLEPIKGEQYDLDKISLSKIDKCENINFGKQSSNETNLKQISHLSVFNIIKHFFQNLKFSKQITSNLKNHIHVQSVNNIDNGNVDLKEEKYTNEINSGLYISLQNDIIGGDNNTSSELLTQTNQISVHTNEPSSNLINFISLNLIDNIGDGIKYPNSQYDAELIKKIDEYKPLIHKKSSSSSCLLDSSNISKNSFSLSKSKHTDQDMIENYLSDTDTSTHLHININKENNKDKLFNSNQDLIQSSEDLNKITKLTYGNFHGNLTRFNGQQFLFNRSHSYEKCKPIKNNSKQILFSSLGNKNNLSLKSINLSNKNDLHSRHKSAPLSSDLIRRKSCSEPNKYRHVWSNEQIYKNISPNLLNSDFYGKSNLKLQSSSTIRKSHLKKPMINEYSVYYSHPRTNRKKQLEKQLSIYQPNKLNKFYDKLIKSKQNHLSRLLKYNQHQENEEVETYGENYDDDASINTLDLYKLAETSDLIMDFDSFVNNKCFQDLNDDNANDPNHKLYLNHCLEQSKPLSTYVSPPQPPPVTMNSTAITPLSSFYPDQIHSGCINKNFPNCYNCSKYIHNNLCHFDHFYLNCLNQYPYIYSNNLGLQATNQFVHNTSNHSVLQHSHRSQSTNHLNPVHMLPLGSYYTDCYENSTSNQCDCNSHLNIHHNCSNKSRDKKYRSRNSKLHKNYHKKKFKYQMVK